MEAETQTDICIPVFIVALFTVAKSWKWPKCTLANKWLNKSFCIYAVVCYSAFRRKEILTYCNMDEPWWCYTKWCNPITKGQSWLCLYAIASTVKFLTEGKLKGRCQQTGRGGNYSYCLLGTLYFPPIGKRRPFWICSTEILKISKYMKRQCCSCQTNEQRNPLSSFTEA